MSELENVNEKDIVVYEKTIDAISKRTIFKITSQEKLKEANDGLSELKKYKKFIIEKKEKITIPASLTLKNAREFFKPIENKIEEIEQSVKTEIIAYKKIVDEAIEKQREKIEAKVDSGETTFEKGSQQMEKTEAKVEQFKTRKIKEVEIVDERLIHEKYWMLNLVLLRKDALAGINIPGVKVVGKEIAIM